jgi:mevalonate kinase
MTTASAPGKIILFGEHAVVYGQPALAVPVFQVHVEVRIEDGSEAGILIDAPEIALHAQFSSLPSTNPLHTTIEYVLKLYGILIPPALTIQITSTIPVASGLGSGAAVSVAVIRALAAHLGHAITAEQVNHLAYQVEKIHHGTPSGIDNTAITYAKPVYFVRGQPIETLQVNTPFTLVIADTGISAPTKESVQDVRKLWDIDSVRWERVFKRVGEIAEKARQAIENGTWQEMGNLMDANHALLQEMTVSSPELDRLIVAAKASGAQGAKLSGGGRGGNMIALVQPEIAGEVASALLSAGAHRTIITTIQ